jgi:hypothetical protein
VICQGYLHMQQARDIKGDMTGYLHMQQAQDIKGDMTGYLHTQQAQDTKRVRTSLFAYLISYVNVSCIANQVKNANAS